MEIIRKTQGIDQSAKGSGLQGHAALILKDAATGKITEKIEQKNFFTSGLDSAINGCPFFLDANSFSYKATNGTADQRTPIKDQLLGGITLYPQSLGSDTDLLFPPFSNEPTGYASIDSYTQTDPKQGAYDAANSGAITNGWRHIYSWGSNFGNGQIAAVALNPRGSHNWVKDLTTAINPIINRSAQNGAGYVGFTSYEGGNYIVAASEHGVLYRKAGNTAMWAFAKIKPFAIDLIQPYSPAALENITPEWTVPVSQYGTNWQFIGDKLANISLSGTTLTVTLIDITDGSVDSTDTYTFSAAFGNGHSCITGGYFYCAKNSAGTIYKCNLSNVADVTEIENTAIVANEPVFDVGSTWIYGSHVLIDAANGIAQAITNPADGWAWNYDFPIWETGIWLVTGSNYGWYNNVRGIGAAMKRWACMTHANLESTVTKTPDKEMIVQYSILQV